MRTKLLLGLLLAGSMMYVNAQVQIADFESGSFEPNGTEGQVKLDGVFSAVYIENSEVTSYEIVDNPETDGLNTSTSALKVVNGEGHDGSGLIMIFESNIIKSENRYIHIMMKFQNVGIQNFHFDVFPAAGGDGVRSILTNGGSYWFDYVIDLNDINGSGASIDGARALRYLPRSANNTNPNNVIYIDEIIANNDPTPRGGYNQIEEAMTIADFNDGSLNKLVCSNDGGGIASFEVADNPDASDINTSSKALKFVTSADGDWWPGLLIVFPKPVVVNAETRYLHVMMYAEESGQTYEFALNLTNQNYAGQASMAAGWKDYVFDLGAKYMGQKLAGFRHCTRVDGVSNRNKVRYIDEIAVSSDPRPRGAYIDFAGPIADFNDGTFNKLTCADNGNGVAAGSIEVVDNPSMAGLNTSEKSLKFVVGSTAGDFWQGLKIDLPKVIFVNENTRYLHVMTYNTTNDQSYEFNVFASGENYMGEKTTKEGWEDHVIDLNGIMGQNVTGFRYATRIDNAKNLGKTRYIDEIIVNDDPSPRTAIPTSMPDNLVPMASVVNSSNGITIQGVEGKFFIYNTNGALVQTGIATGNTQVNLPKGFYIVKIDSAFYKVSVK